jgi:hypothetical protein
VRCLIPFEKTAETVLVHILAAVRASSEFCHGDPPILLPPSPHET